MKLRVLGCAGAEFPGHHPPAFLVDDILLFDAGTIGAVLTEPEQQRLQTIFLTHAHLDHVRGIPSLADNLIVSQTGHTLDVCGSRETIDALRRHLFNNVVWPDFTAIPSREGAVLRYGEITPGVDWHLAGYTVTAYPVHHSIPAVGYVIRHGETTLIYSGDTGPTQKLWEQALNPTAVIIEVSLPNQMEAMALLTGHLTPRLMAAEIAKIGQRPETILITHPKLQYLDQIRAEIADLGLTGVRLLQDGDIFTF